ncbi:MAG TPA: DinB family protein [Candidatus Sulfomarinibacteraceae bacterium]|nr:DinB family protein [Candidatus Sulfomarinibacteraceae bacterium]
MNDEAFAPQALAADLTRVHEIYSDFFSGLTANDWRYPSENGDEEWNLREVMAHLGALTTFGQESIEAALRGEAIAFPGFTNRFEFAQFNRRQIDERLDRPPEALSADFLQALARSIETASHATADQLDCAVDLPIYNRPIRVGELLGIQIMHTGLTHAAQVTEPAGAPPLWTHMEPDMRRRTIGRVMRALSLLYRQDLGGHLEAVLQFQVKGEGGGKWHVILSPQIPSSAQGAATPANLTLSFRDTASVCRMFTGRLNLLSALITGRLRLRGDLRLFLRFRSLFSVDAPA